MSVFVPQRRFDPAVLEMMDRPGQNLSLLRDDLAVLEQINRHLGGLQIPLHYIPRFACRHSLSVLDLGSGAADVPREIVRWSRKRGLDVRITAVDANPDILNIARERCEGFPEIRFELYNILALPYAPASFDVVLCSLTLHHFAELDAVAILQRIRDIARVGYIVNDLRRNRAAIWLSKLMARTIITNPIARFDAPASCERAYSVTELRALAERAGLANFELHRHVGLRMALVGTE